MNLHAILIVAIAVAATVLTRALPFALFGGKRGMPKTVRYLGEVLPAGIIAILVVYCLKSLPTGSFGAGAAQLIALACVAGLHLYKGNTLLSIFGGTAIYMVLIRLSYFG